MLEDLIHITFLRHARSTVTAASTMSFSGIPLRILHVITTLNRGGCENYLVELTTRQKLLGHDVTVVYFKGTGYWAQHLKDAGIRVAALDLRRYGELTPLWRLRRLIRSVSADILHAHMQPAELYSSLALAAIPDRPAFVIGKHNDEPFYRGPGERTVGRLVAQRAERLIAVSEAVKKFVCDHHHLPASTVATIHYGIDARPFEQVGTSLRLSIRAAWNVPEEAILFGTAARFTEQKALHVLLRGYARYRQSAKLASRLALLGQGELEQDLKRLARELNIADEVIWPGFRTDIHAVMSAFDVFALTSVREGLGLSILEAMSTSKPVIATEVGGIREILAGENVGLLCKVNSPQAIADAMLRCESTPFRAQIGAAGHARVKNAFSIEKMIAETSAVYDEAIKANRRRPATLRDGMLP